MFWAQIGENSVYLCRMGGILMDLYSWCFLAHFLQMYVSFHWNLNFYEFPDESTSFGGIFCFFGGFFWFFLCFWGVLGVFFGFFFVFSLILRGMKL